VVERGDGILINLQRLLRMARRRHCEGSTTVLLSTDSEMLECNNACSVRRHEAEMLRWLLRCKVSLVADVEVRRERG
jgi:hypothetical protein